MKDLNQLLLKFDLRQNYQNEDFYVNESNFYAYSLIEKLAIITNGKYNTKRNRFVEQASWSAKKPSSFSAKSHRVANQDVNRSKREKVER